MADNESSGGGGGIKDLLGLLKRKPALAIAAVVGIIVLVLLLYKKSGSSTTTAATTTAATTATTGTGSNNLGTITIQTQSDYGGHTPQHLRSDTTATSATMPATNPAASPTTPAQPTTTAVPVPSNNSNPIVGTTTPSAAIATFSIRSRVGSLGSGQGVPVRSTPGGTVVGYEQYGSGGLSASGPGVTGPNNNPVSGGAGSTIWTPIQYNGKTSYISNYDLRS